MGEPFVVTGEGEAQQKADQFREYIRTPVLSQVEFDAGGLDIYDVEPVSIPDILAERPVVVFGKWRGEPEGTMTLSGKTGLGDYATQIDLGQVEPTDADAALRYLWARHRIAILGDFAGPNPTDELKSEITRLGLAYNLLTSYTSFVAVDQIVRNDGTELTEVRQPLPLPQGVEDSAVGGGMAASAVTERLMTTTWFGKTFYLSDGVWVDSAYLPGMLLEEYRPTDSPRELQNFASLERDMIVVAQNRAFRLQGASLPIAPVLFQNAPNPFNSGTAIHFQLSDRGGADLTIYDLTGQKIRTYALHRLGPGEHQVNWDGRDDHGRQAASGTYLYRLTTPNYARTRKMILLR